MKKMKKDNDEYGSVKKPKKKYNRGNYKTPRFLQEAESVIKDYVDDFHKEMKTAQNGSKTAMSGTLAGIVREPMKKKSKKKTTKKTTKK